jgi:Protein of unknown function (DUF2711)
MHSNALLHSSYPDHRSRRNLVLSCRVQLENYVYPFYGTPLVEAFGGRFEAAFIVLHPFIHVPDFLSWKVTHLYPGDQQIVAHGTRYPWTAVGAHTGLASCARINQALLTAIGSLKGDLADPSGREALQTFLQSNSIWMPAEGRFEPLLHWSFLQVFAAAGMDKLIFVPEIPNSEHTLRLPIQGLKNGSIPFPNCGTLLAPDESFLFTVDWDSFFTLFYGPRAFVGQTAGMLDLEGFFATPNTDHAWFNYSLGCATITVSPEDWQQTR